MAWTNAYSNSNWKPWKIDNAMPGYSLKQRFAEDIDREAEFGYKAARPRKCCANCAFSDYIGRGRECRCIKLHTVAIERHANIEDWCETCGCCMHWLSRDITLAAKSCSSYEEFSLKKSVLTENIVPTPELDEWFSERKATEKMKKLADSIMRDSCEGGSFPITKCELMIRPRDIRQDGTVTDIVKSDAFYSVQHWISENKPAWESWLETERKRKDRLSDMFTGIDYGLSYEDEPTAVYIGPGRKYWL